jgi:hypothetical protein
LGKPTKPTNRTKKLSRWVNSHYCFRGTFIMQTFGAACERMPNIWDQRPMQHITVIPRALACSCGWCSSIQPPLVPGAENIVLLENLLSNTVLSLIVAAAGSVVESCAGVLLRLRCGRGAIAR